MTVYELPASFMAGTTLDVTLSYADYPSTSYSGTLIVINSGNRYSVSATASGSSYNFLESASGTNSWTAGDYTYSVLVSGSSNIYQVETGFITITPNLSTATDTRSQVKRTLDNINAVLENKASEDVLNYTIAGRSIGKMNISELLKLRSYYQSLYEAEVRKVNGTSSLVRFQFREPR